MKLTRRPSNGATDSGDNFIISSFCSALFCILGLFLLILGCVHLRSDSSMIVIMTLVPIPVAVLLFLQRLIQDWLYNKWRRSFADEQISTDSSNHWFPQFYRYIPFSWWKKLRQGPWNALKRRRDTGVAEIPFEPIQSNIDKPPGPSAQGS